MAGKPTGIWADTNLQKLRSWALPYHRTGKVIPWSKWPYDFTTPDGAKNHWRRLVLAGHAEAPAPASLRGTAPAPDEVPEGVRRALDGMEPIRTSPPSLPKHPLTPSDTDIIAGDFHWPLADAACEDVLLQAVAEHRPRRFVLNGDGPDLLAISRYPKDVRKEWSLVDERVAMHTFIKRLADLMAKWGGAIVETNANHSGDGTEGRWWRFLSERLGPLATLPEVIDALSYQRIWHPPWASIALVDHHEIVPGFIALHGDIARKQAAYSARGMMDKWRVSLIHNHTHRMGMTANRIPAIGSRGETDVVAYENGCMCRLDPSYVSAPDWQQGFAIVRYDAAGHFNVEQVRIRSGVAVIGGPGKVYGVAA